MPKPEPDTAKARLRDELAELRRPGDLPVALLMDSPGLLRQMALERRAEAAACERISRNLIRIARLPALQAAARHAAAPSRVRPPAKPSARPTPAQRAPAKAKVAPVAGTTAAPLPVPPKPKPKPKRRTGVGLLED